MTEKTKAFVRLGILPFAALAIYMDWKVALFVLLLCWIDNVIKDVL